MSGARWRALEALDVLRTAVDRPDVPDSLADALQALAGRPAEPIRAFEVGRLYYATLAHPCFGRRTHWTAAEGLHLGKRVQVRFAGANAYGEPFFRLAHAKWDSGCIPAGYLTRLGMTP